MNAYFLAVARTIAVTAMGFLLPVSSLLAGPRPAAPATGDGEADAEAKLKGKAKAHKDAGKVFFDKGEYRDALEEYRKALELRRTGSVLANIAGCLKELGQYDEALEQYEEVLRESKDAKLLALVTPFVTELTALMGTLVLHGDKPEGASLFVDGRVRGKLPLSAPLRLSKGVHKIRVEKEGFAAITTSVEVSAGQEAKVQLVARSRKGRLSVSEKHGWALHVEVDGKDVGVTPWRDLVDPGEHQVRLHGFMGVEALATCETPEVKPGENAAAAREGAEMESKVETATVKLYEETAKVLSAEEQDAPLKVESTPEGAELRIDSKEMGKTPWEGRLGLGEHVIEVSARGFVSKKQEVRLKRREQPVLSVALERESKPDTAGLRTPRTVGAGVAYGVGALGLGVFWVSGSLAIATSHDIKVDCPNDRCPASKGAKVRAAQDKLHTLEAVSAAGFVVGAAGVAAGTIVLLVGRPGGAERRAGTRGVAWTAGVGLGRVELGGKF